jgi:hypothetical protein
MNEIVTLLMGGMVLMVGLVFLFVMIVIGVVDIYGEGENKP